MREDETDGGYVATALGHAIATQGDTVVELRKLVRDAVHCHFGDGLPGAMLQIIRLHFVRDAALAVLKPRATATPPTASRCRPRSA